MPLYQVYGKRLNDADEQPVTITLATDERTARILVDLEHNTTQAFLEGQQYLHITRAVELTPDQYLAATRKYGDDF